MQLPTVPQSALKLLHPINLDDVPKRYMNPGELEVLCALISSVKPRRVIEFGCNVGRTAKVLLREVPSISSYVGIDIPPDSDYLTQCACQRTERPQHPGYLVTDDYRFSMILRDRGSLDLGPDDLRTADAVFIDGDHGRRAVIHDTVLATMILRPGGIIVWHDYHDLGVVDVKPVLEELQDKGRKIIHVEGTWLAYERRKFPLTST